VLVQLGRDVCGDFGEATSREWLEANGLGGYASSTVCGANTRKYHGLLVGATRHAIGRYVFLSSLEESVIQGDKEYAISTNIYEDIDYPDQDVIHPEGYKHLVEFRLDPFPVAVFEVGESRIEKTIFMVHGENTVVILYRLLAPSKGCQLNVRPLLAFRYYHRLSEKNSFFDESVEEMEGVIGMSPYYELPAMHLYHNARMILSGAYWYYNFKYPRERERRLEDQEDLLSPFALVFEISPERPAYIIASIEERRRYDVDVLLADEAARRSTVAGRWKHHGQDPLVANLVDAAEKFLFTRRQTHHGIMAGYQWFTDWGRDTMIALPGLALTTGRHDFAREVLVTFSKYQDRGLFPTRFEEEPDKVTYGSADPALWYFWAVYKYVGYTGDLETVRNVLYDVMAETIDWYRRGTLFGIHMDDDGLIWAGVALGVADDGVAFGEARQAGGGGHVWRHGSEGREELRRSILVVRGRVPVRSRGRIVSGQVDTSEPDIRGESSV